MAGGTHPISLKTLSIWIISFFFLSNIVAPQAIWSTSTTSLCFNPFNHTDSTLPDFRANLRILLDTLVANSSESGFSSSTYGQPPYKVYGLYLCRGDLTPDLCHDCIANASEINFDACQDSSKAVMTQKEKCMLRYANYSISNQLDMRSLSVDSNSSTKASNPIEFNRTLAATVKDLIEDAAFNSTKFFATREVSLGVEDGILYSLAQCTPDIGGSNCSVCLKKAFSGLQQCCGGLTYGAYMYPSCQLRYQNSTFYEVGGAGKSFSYSYARSYSTGLLSLVVVLLMLG